MNPYNLSLLFFGSCSVFMGVLVWLKRQDSIGKYYFLFSFFATGWAVGVSIIINQYVGYQTALFGARLCNGMASLIPVIWVRFVLLFLGKEEPFKHFFALNLCIAILLVLSAFTPWMAKGLAPILDFKYYTLPGPCFYLFTGVFFTLIPYSFYQLIRSYYKSGGEFRDQLRYLIIGSSIAFASGGATFFPVFRIPFPQYLLFLMPLYPLVMAIGLVRYGLFDAQQIADAFQREKMAAIGTLASSINHEIRNPLYVIQGLAESHLINYEEGIYANPQTAVDKANDILKRIREHAGRAMEIMKNFALFARQNPSTANVSSISLDDVLNGVFPLVRHEMDFEKIEFVKNIPQGLSPVRLDIRQGEEIFFNLIVNACQAIKRRVQDGICEFQDETPDSKKSGRIEISASQNNGSVRVVVKDNGPGISARQTSQIFEPFYTTRKEGTGLGLYVTRQLVEKNGGKISVQSKEGQGTSFLLELKRA